MSNEIVKKELPKLADLIREDSVELVLKRDQLNYLLNQPTPKQWIKKHPYVNIDVLQDDGSKKKEPLEYIPVERTKLLLTQIFGGFTDRITDIKQIFNSVVVTIELTVIDPLTGKEITHSGIGAVGVQLDAGNTASDVSKIKHDAVTKAAPAAASYALKNAAEKLGTIFGSALQKYDLSPYMPFYNEELKQAINKQLQARYDGANTGNK